MVILMTTNNQPLNISQKNVFGKCDLKCAYNFKYSGSNSTAKNNGVSINLTYDNSSVPPVIYNNQKYTVSKINIYSPSLHLYNGKKVNGEFIVEHVPVTGGALLYVCIPIIQSNNSSSSGGIITQIIQNVSTNAPSDGDSTNLNLSDFTLEDIIPKKPYYNYTNTSSSMPGDYILFGYFDAIPLNDQTIAILTKIIIEFPIDMLGNNLFYNPNGPNSSSSLAKEGIYISCQPTDSSKEKIDITENKNETVYDMATMLNNPVIYFILQILIGGIVFISLYFVINYIFNKLVSTKPKSQQNVT